MKKKLSLILMLCFMVLGLAACGDATAKDYYGMTYAELQDNIQADVEGLAASDTSRIDAYGEDIVDELVSGWDETTAELGSLEGFGEFTITTAQNTMTVEQYVEFPGREVSVAYVYSYNYTAGQMEITDASVDLVYTLSEKMEKAGLNTLMGMGTVFVVLILISLIISCFRIIPYLENKKKEEKASVAAPDPVVTQIGQREEQQLTDDLELVAVISAAIAASEGTSADGFVVRSIRRR